MASGDGSPPSEYERKGQEGHFNAGEKGLPPSVVSLLPGKLRHALLGYQIVFVALFGALLGICFGFGSRWLLLREGRLRRWGGYLLLSGAGLWVCFVWLCLNYAANYE
jgi:hypothetical protein